MDGLLMAIDELRTVRDIVSLSMNRTRDGREDPRNALDDAMATLDHRVSELLRSRGAIKMEMNASEPDHVLLVDEDLFPEVQGSMDIHGWLRLVRQDRPRAFVPWESDEDVRMVRMTATGMTTGDMARALHRTEGEVADRSPHEHPPPVAVVVGAVKARPTNAGKRWVDEEGRRLTDMFRSGDGV